jgi:hypothetical protein
VKPDNAVRSGPVELFSAFDYEKKLLRFDRKEQLLAGTIMGGDDDKNPSHQAPVPSEQGGKLVLTPTATDIWHLGDSMAITYPPEKDVSRSVRPFDVRAVGLYDWLGMMKGYSFEQMYSTYLKMAVDSVEEKGRVHKLILLAPAGRRAMRIEIWLDATRGFSPVRMQRCFRSGNSPTGQWSHPDVIVETAWDEQNGIWLPKSWKIASYSRDSRLIERYDLAFEWQSVNSVSSELFEKDGFSLKQGTYHVDLTGDRPIITDIVGGGKPPTLHEVGTTDKLGKGTQASKRRIATIAMGLVAMAAVVGLFCLRRRRLAREKGS